MSFFNRNKEAEKKELPEKLSNLPEVRLPELPNSEGNEQPESFQPLPKLPENITGNSIGLQAIKSNVGFNQKDARKTIEMDELEEVPEQKQIISEKEPIFIKIDKFKEALAKFSEIKEKISDIDDSIKQIKEIKEKEDRELKEWEQEVQIIKEKVANIDSSLFSRI